MEQNICSIYSASFWIRLFDQLAQIKLNSRRLYNFEIFT